LERKPSDKEALVRFGEAPVNLDRSEEARLVLEQAVGVSSPQQQQGDKEDDQSNAAPSIIGSSSASFFSSSPQHGEGQGVVVAAVDNNSSPSDGSDYSLKKRRNGRKVGSGSSAGCIMAEVGALYVLLSRLYFTPDVGDGTSCGTVSEEEEALGVEAFLKESAYASYTAAHQPTAAAALAPLYEACGLKRLSAEKSAIKVCVCMEEERLERRREKT
jgi:hypothetical protein